MPDPDLDLDALDALCAAATKGPWVAFEDDLAQDGPVDAWSTRYASLTTPDEDDPRSAGLAVDDTNLPIAHFSVYDKGKGEARANLEFCAAARTALPALMARVRALAQENATLRAENTMLHGPHWHLHAIMIE